MRHARGYSEDANQVSEECEIAGSIDDMAVEGWDWQTRTQVGRELRSLQAVLAKLNGDWS
jgi:hypothetical protein